MKFMLLTVKKHAKVQSRVSLTTQTAHNVNHSQTRGADALEDPAERLKDYGIGARIRALRLKKKIGHWEFATYTQDEWNRAFGAAALIR